MIPGIEIRDYDRRDLQQTKQFGHLYGVVFGGEPWNERGKCLSCGKFLNKSRGFCTSCITPGSRGEVRKAYPLKPTMDYIKEEAAKPLAVVKLAFDDSGHPVGFSIAYQTDVESFVRTKYPDESGEPIAKALYDSGIRGKIIYGSEVGVDPNKQRKGLGRELVKPWGQLADETDSDFVVRTQWRSGMTRLGLEDLRMRQVLGFQVEMQRIGVNGSSRIELSANQDLIISGLDPINQDRIILARNALCNPHN